MASLPAEPQAPNSRPYRSKRARPCDLCRSRKVCCRIQTVPPCMLCEKVGVECTFIERPSKRQKLWDSRTPGNLNTATPGAAAYANADFSRGQASQTESNVMEAQELSAGISHDVPTQALDMSNHGPGDAVDSSLFPVLDEHGLDINQLDSDYSPNGGDAQGDFSNLLSEADRAYFWDSLGGNFLNLMPNGVHDTMEPGEDGEAENTTFTEAGQQSKSYPAYFPRVIERNVTPVVNSLDDRSGTNAQYFGLSGESDPYLLRHYRYDAQGEFRFFKLTFRKAADDIETDSERVPQQPHPTEAGLAGAIPNDEQQEQQLPNYTPNQIPVHFKISADELAADIKEETVVRPGVSSETVRKELYELVKVEDGVRLIGLFLKYVFPSFPAISRSQLGITPAKPIPSVSSLEKVPTHLLAAVYASSLIFCPYDDRLCVSNVYTRPSAAKIWRIAYEEILREIHTPHLSVVQAALLYLHKPPTGAASAASDTPFHWSFMGIIMGLSSSLALHLDCHDWMIPAWEKRLRRRLWWMIYVEEKWRSLLGGFPTLINSDQWDVSELTEHDFLIDEGIGTGVPDTNQGSGNEDLELGVRFRHLAKLSLIVEDVHRSFYTLRAARLLSRDFHLSITTAQPLRHRLKAWYSMLPASLQIRNRSIPEDLSCATMDSNSALHLAYLSLEILLYRALLRPLGRRRAQVPPVSKTNPTDRAPGQNALNNNNASPPAFHHEADAPIEGVPFGEMHEAAEAVILAAENCAKIVTSFAASLDSRDFAGFWYSWSRVGFATMSNFAMLLLVQAPTAQHAQDSKAILDTWRRTLRIQSKSFEQMNLGLLRLDAVHWSGAEQLFVVDRHVLDVL